MTGVAELTDRYILRTYDRIPAVVERGKGCWIWSDQGKKLLDLTSGIGTSCLGHSHKALQEAIRVASERIVHSSNLFYIGSQAKLARELVEASDGSAMLSGKVFFCNSGTEAIEGAIKFARLWGKANGARHKILATHGSFHGRTFGALSATGTRCYRSGFEPLLQGFEFVDYGDADAVGDRLNKSADFCAVMLEPVQGENGVIVPPSGYLGEVREHCNRHKVLLILDEVQTGMGRTGQLFAYQHEGIVPDIMALAKGLGGGVPCGAVLLSNKVTTAVPRGSHGSTFGGNPLATSCGLAVMKIINNQTLLSKIRHHGQYFIKKLTEIQNNYPSVIADVRGVGLMIGIQLRTKELAQEVISKCIDSGLLTIRTADTVMRILPPLIISKEEIDFALRIIEKEVKGACG